MADGKIFLHCPQIPCSFIMVRSGCQHLNSESRVAIRNGGTTPRASWWDTWALYSVLQDVFLLQHAQPQPKSVCISNFKFKGNTKEYVKWNLQEKNKTNPENRHFPRHLARSLQKAKRRTDLQLYRVRSHNRMQSVVLDWLLVWTKSAIKCICGTSGKMWIWARY